MALLNKNDITILLPCYNEAHEIERTVKHYKACGFNKILVIDDGSLDETAKTAEKAGANVLRNNLPNGFLLTALRGIYEVDTEMGLIIDPDKLPRSEDLDEFIAFGVAGHYGLLFSKSETNGHITRYLKKKYGVFVADPNFEVVLLSRKILEATKDDFIMVETYLYFNLIAHAINNKCKIGTYPLRLPTPKGWTRARAISSGHFRGEDSYNDFFRYAFPDMEKKQLNNSIKIAIASAVLGVGATILTQWVVSFLD